MTWWFGYGRRNVGRRGGLYGAMVGAGPMTPHEGCLDICLCIPGSFISSRIQVACCEAFRVKCYECTSTLYPNSWDPDSIFGGWLRTKGQVELNCFSLESLSTSANIKATEEPCKMHRWLPGLCLRPAASESQRGIEPGLRCLCYFPK